MITEGERETCIGEGEYKVSIEREEDYGNSRVPGWSREEEQAENWCRAV